MSAPSSQLQQPPATPTYVLRGHAAPIHALHLFNQNLRLISGDANGWIIIWDLVIKRPVAVWKAHEGAVLEVKGFSVETGTVTNVYTHGRDHKLRVWSFRIQDERFLQKTLPVDASEISQSSAQNQPWLLHSLPVNALNFCAFSMLFLKGSPHAGDEKPQAPEARIPEGSANPSISESASRLPVLIAVPNALDSGAIDLFHLPLERRVCTIPADTAVKTGMVMTTNLFMTSSGELYAASAYEDGHVMVFARRGPLREQDIVQSASIPWKWEKLYACRPHTQPALSIDVLPQGNYFFSSSADALLVKHPIPPLGHPGPLVSSPEESPLKTVNTKHAGQQGLRIRSDGKIFATAGWDSRIRVYSCKTMKELAVLKWHKEGCYAVAFADVSASTTAGPSDLTTIDAKPEEQDDNDANSLQLTRRTEGALSLANVQYQRNQKVQKTHWLAAGSKDGKISLWDIY